MLLRLLALAALPALVLGCGSSTKTAATNAAPTPTTNAPVSPAPTALTVYFLREGVVAPVRVQVPHTRAVATAALGALLEGPPEGYETAIPEGTTLESLSIDAGVAHPAFSDELDAAARAQVVYTLTRFPTVTGVALPGAGEPLTRDEFEQQTPRILVESPLPGETVDSPLRATGTSNDTEATFQLELVQDGKVLAATHVIATSGNGERGTFAQELAYDGTGAATLVAYERNAGEGPPQLGRVEIPVVLR